MITQTELMQKQNSKKTKKSTGRQVNSVFLWNYLLFSTKHMRTYII